MLIDYETFVFHYQIKSGHKILGALLIDLFFFENVKDIFLRKPCALEKNCSWRVKLNGKLFIVYYR